MTMFKQNNPYREILICNIRSIHTLNTQRSLINYADIIGNKTTQQIKCKNTSAAILCCITTLVHRHLISQHIQHIEHIQQKCCC